MKQLNAILTNAIFALQVLLLFLVLFESKISLPPLVQTFGRMHPLLLHLPIGLLVLLGLLPLVKRELEPASSRKIQGFVLHFTALTAVATALLGLFLAQEGGYGDELDRHKWTGIVLSWLTYGLLLVHEYGPERVRLFNGGLIAGLVLVVLTGHFGANLTHGKGYLTAPLKKEKAPVITEETTVYVAAIAPILEAKCYNCHNERKSKGELVMTSVEKLLAGGENGPVWVAGDAAGSRLIQRVNLPLENEEHMPPEGKPQLFPAEIQLLYAWIQAGADTEQTIGQLPPGDSLQLLVQPLLEAVAKSADRRPKYDFKPASPKTIESLNNPYRSVIPAAANSPALNADIFVRQTYEPRYLEELGAVREQLVSLNLSNLPIKDEDLATIAQFENLEKLILNGTDITGATLAELSANQKLGALAISNTQVGANVAEALAQLPALKELFAWNTAMTSDELSELQEKYPKLTVHTGYQPDPEEKLALSVPILKNKEQVLQPGERVELKHNFPGVTLRYTTDGSEPDSLESPIYEGPFAVEGAATIKVKAYHEGWLSSPAEEFSLFNSGLKADSIRFIEQPDAQFPGDGLTTLQDRKKGERVNFRSGAWLGYRETPFSALFFFDKKGQTVEQAVVSYLQNMGSYIMPPVFVELWGGDSPDQLQLLKKITPEAPMESERNAVKTIVLDIPPSSYRCYKIVAQNVKKLPDWHRGAGDKGWFFVDEVFFY
jgi:hypothetical protein